MCWLSASRWAGTSVAIADFLSTLAPKLAMV
jgi:hypothetical protein